MKLTDGELKLVANIDQLRKQKIKGLIGVTVVLVVYWILRYVELLRRYANNDADTITALSERK